ncbi:unnamed protein product [Didymodactylos carnosus]|uniref:Calpain catalytic domain-containing protein n=1 Tax=Didymodactylos carnosus TaxID=1234261 RepID=A0A813RA81_9BILA|nr:unnamed protein product [Didymodactylos carnosus]CAF3562724.1 unnamed protein product [Didymodactylos carnosus]
MPSKSERTLLVPFIKTQLFDSIQQHLPHEPAFIDQSFSTNSKSLGDLVSSTLNIIWKRPKEFCNNPVFTVNHVRNFQPNESSTETNVFIQTDIVIQTPRIKSPRQDDTDFCVAEVIATTKKSSVDCNSTKRYSSSLNADVHSVDYFYTKSNDILSPFLTELLCVIMVLKEYSGLYTYIIPPNQMCDSKIYHFRLYRFGQFNDVCIDNYLPLVETKDTTKHRLLGLNNVNVELWLPLLAKACAKFFGSYSALINEMNNLKLWKLFTGSIQQQYDIPKISTTKRQSLLSSAQHTSDLRTSKQLLNNENLYYQLKFSCSNNRALIITRINDEIDTSLDMNQNATLANNNLFQKGIYYIIQQVIQLNRKQDSQSISLLDSAYTYDATRIRQQIHKFRYLQLFNTQRTRPFLYKIEDSITDDYDIERDLNLSKLKDGEFWISYAMLLKYFDTVIICHISSDEFVIDSNRYYLSSTFEWKLLQFHGRWIKGINSGGSCIRKINDKWSHKSQLDIECDYFRQNPQYCICISKINEEFLTQKLVSTPNYRTLTPFMKTGVAPTTLTKTQSKLNNKPATLRSSTDSTLTNKNSLLIKRIQPLPTFERTVLISLTQQAVYPQYANDKNLSLEFCKSPLEYINVQVFRIRSTNASVNPNIRFSMEQLTQVASSGPYINDEEVILVYNIQSDGKYLIIPSIIRSDIERNYLLRIFFDDSLNIYDYWIIQQSVYGNVQVEIPVYEQKRDCSHRHDRKQLR